MTPQMAVAAMTNARRALLALRTCAVPVELISVRMAGIARKSGWSAMSNSVSVVRQLVPTAENAPKV